MVERLNELKQLLVSPESDLVAVAILKGMWERKEISRAAIKNMLFEMFDETYIDAQHGFSWKSNDTSKIYKALLIFYRSLLGIECTLVYDEFHVKADTHTFIYVEYFFQVKECVHTRFKHPYRLDKGYGDMVERFANYSRRAFVNRVLNRILT